MQLCIEQLLYRIKLHVVFVLAFFCPANIYRPSQGKARLGRNNPTQLQRLNFYLRRNKKHSIQNFMHYKSLYPDF